MNQSSSGILFLLSISVGVAMIGLGIIWPLIPVYAVQLGAGGFLVGLIIASFNVARTFANPIAGRFSDKWGRKQFIVIGLFLYAVVSVFYVQPARAEVLVLVRFFHGLTSVLVVPIAMALTADIAPKQKLGLYMGTLNMAVMLGLGIGPVLGGIIRDHFGMDAAFYAMGGLALLTSILVMIFIPSRYQGDGQKKEQTVTSFRKLISHRVVMGIFFMRFFAASGQGAVYTFLPILALQLKLSSSQVGVILGANIFLIAFLQRVFGSVADRINPKYLLILGTFASGLTVLGMPFVDGFFMILLLNIFMGLANGVAMPGGLVITGQLGRTMGMASLMSVTDAGWSLGMIVSPILSGIIMDTLGLPSIFIVGSILILIGSGVVSLFLREYQPEEE